MRLFTAAMSDEDARPGRACGDDRQFDLVGVQAADLDDPARRAMAEERIRARVTVAAELGEVLAD